jgi:hypothetical protein
MIGWVYTLLASSFVFAVFALQVAALNRWAATAAKVVAEWHLAVAARTPSEQGSDVLPALDLPPMPFLSLAPGVLGTLAVGTATAWSFRSARRNELHLERRREAVQEAEEALEHHLRGDQDGEGQRKPAAGEEAPHLALAHLWAVTHRRLDLYHNIALEQSKKSFRNAQGAMVTGFILLAGCVIVAVTSSTTAGAVAAGSLGAVAAGLAGYVARTFVRSQEVAATHLRTYFDQPVEFSRYLAAERLVAEATLSAHQREKLVAVLVRAMVAGPPGPTPGGSA